MDIDQGNRIDQDKLEQLQVGMTRRQVEFLLGKPAIDSPFHADQAHYIYYFFDGGEKTSEQKTMTLTYDNDVLVDISGAL